MEQVIIGGYYNLLHTTTTEYTALQGGWSWSATEANRQQLASTDGILKNLFIELDDVPGTGTYTFTVRVNGAPTGLTCTVAADGTTASDVDLGHAVTITGGDRLTLECNPDSPDNARYARWQVMFEGDNAKESLLLGGSSGSLNSGITEYASLQGIAINWGVTEDTYRQVIPTAGKIKNLYIWLDEDPGTAPEGYTFTLRLNGADGLDGGNPLEVAIVANNTMGFDITHEITVSAGDVVTLECEPISSPSTVPSAFWGMTFVADTDDESIIMASMEDPLDNAATEYAYLTSPYRGGSFDWNGSESQRYQLGQECVLKKFYVLLSGNPGAGGSYTFTVRRNGASPVGGLVVVIQDAETTGNDIVHTIAVSDFDELNMMVVPFSTPNVVNVYWGLVSFTGALAVVEQAVGGGAVGLASSLGVKVLLSVGDGSTGLAGSLGLKALIGVGGGAVGMASSLGIIKRFAQAVGGGAIGMTSTLGIKIKIAVGGGAVGMSNTLGRLIKVTVGSGTVGLASSLGIKIKVTVGGGAIAIAGTLSTWLRVLTEAVWDFFTWG